MATWKRFTRWLFLRDQIDALRAELDDVAARVARIEVMIEADIEVSNVKPAPAHDRRGKEWDIL